jgi:xanthine/uracil permease
MHLALRILALISGLVATVLALVVNALYSASHGILRLAGMNSVATHGWIGLGLIVLGLIGAFLMVVSPLPATVLMIISGIGLIFIVHWFAIFVSPLYFLGAALGALTIQQPAPAQQPPPQQPTSPEQPQSQAAPA